MTLEVVPSSSSYTDDDQKNLKQLLVTFGSMVSLEDIASAYCEAGRDIHSAAEMLSNIQGSTSGTSSSKSQDDEEKTSNASSVSSNILENGQTSKFKPRKCTASMGTISDVIGKNYIASRPQSSGWNEKSKPVILNSDDFPASEIWDEKMESASSSWSESMDSDIEDFLYKMLGNGFQLEKSVIQDVVGQCGYNLPMSIDKLLDLSAATLEKSDDVISIAPRNITRSSHDIELVSSRTQSTHSDTSRRSNTNNVNNGHEPRAKYKNMEREVLESLFSVPHRIEEKQQSSRPIRPVRRSPYGRVVAKPLDDTIIEDFTFITRQPVNDRSDEANQNISYEELRKGVKEHWVTMEEYYKAALVAYIKKDYGSAQKLLEEGDFFMRKAREADERSAQKLIENSHDEEEEFSMNMHDFEPRDALRQMKLHLNSFSGLPSIPCMKVVVGTDGGGSEDGKRKRLITKLLEKEGIPWTEEGNGWIISIRVGEIDPKKLSFAKK